MAIGKNRFDQPVLHRGAASNAAIALRQRGVLLLLSALPSPGEMQERYDRFGKQTLLERMAAQANQCAGELIISSPEAALASPLREKLAREALLVAHPPGTPFPLPALLHAEPRFSAAVSTVAVLSANLPYLDAAALAALFTDLPSQSEGICLAEEEDVHLGIYRRSLLASIAAAGKEGSLSSPRALWEQRTVDVPSPPPLPDAPSAEGLSIASALHSAGDYRRALTRLGFCDPAHPAITLEVFGNLRIRMGCGSLPIRGDSLDTALRVLRAVYPELSRWLPENESLPEHYRFSVHHAAGDRMEVTTRLDHLLQENDQVILFSATVGG